RDTSAATQQSLRDKGAQIVFVNAAQRLITAYVAADRLTALGGVSSVIGAAEVLRPMTSGASAVAARAASASIQPMLCGSVHTEGDTQLKADVARTHWGVDGTGV